MTAWRLGLPQVPQLVPEASTWNGVLRGYWNRLPATIKNLLNRSVANKSSSGICRHFADQIADTGRYRKLQADTLVARPRLHDGFER